MRSGAAVTITLSNGACSGQPNITVPDTNLDVGIAFSFEPLHCPLREFVDDFDRVHPARQLGEHCGLIAQARANFEDHVVRFEARAGPSSPQP